MIVAYRMLIHKWDDMCILRRVSTIVLHLLKWMTTLYIWCQHFYQVGFVFIKSQFIEWILLELEHYIMILCKLEIFHHIFLMERTSLSPQFSFHNFVKKYFAYYLTKHVIYTHKPRYDYVCTYVHTVKNRNIVRLKI